MKGGVSGLRDGIEELIPKTGPYVMMAKVK